MEGEIISIIELSPLVFGEVSKACRIFVLYKLGRKLSQISSLLLSLSLNSQTSFIYTDRSHHYFSASVSYQLQQRELILYHLHPLSISETLSSHYSCGFSVSSASDHLGYDNLADKIQSKHDKCKFSVSLSNLPMPSNYYIGETSSKRSNNGSKSDHSKMEGRKWEELNMDCLVNVFRRVGMESLLLDVPFVCKSWYKASLDPKCWERLIFPKYIKPDGIWDTGPLGERLMMQYRESFSVTAFIKSVVARSQRHATLLRLPICCTKEALEYAANESPTLKTLDLDAVLLFKQSTIIPKLISKWKNLEMLTLGSRRNMVEILSQIRIYVGKDEVTAMITSLPNLKYLDLKGSTIEQKNLVMILQGCKELQLLDVRDCIGFWEGNAEILELASHIPKFMCEGSIYEEYDTYIDGDVDSDYYSG
ncbi:hypothetical protein AAG906_003668 [Vitis piasezkii]